LVLLKCLLLLFIEAVYALVIILKLYRRQILLAPTGVLAPGSLLFSAPHWHQQKFAVHVSAKSSSKHLPYSHTHSFGTLGQLLKNAPLAKYISNIYLTEIIIQKIVYQILNSIGWNRWLKCVAEDRFRLIVRLDYIMIYTWLMLDDDLDLSYHSHMYILW
jgi:hypothetical protein